MKNIDTNTLSEAQTNGAYPIELVSIELDINDSSKNLYLNTGYKDILYNGNIYTPGSRVLGFSAVEETQDIKTNSITVQLNGVPTTIIQALEATNVKPIGGRVTIYQSFFDEDLGSVIQDTSNQPAIYQKWQGIIYSFSTTEENENSNRIKINIECKNILIAILDTKSGRFTSQSSFQQINSTDTSMEFVPGIINFNPQFGKDN